MISKLDYNKRTKSSDIATRNNAFVSRCVKQQNHQKKLEPRLLYAQQQQHNKVENTTKAKSRTASHVESSHSRISSVAFAAIDYPQSQLISKAKDYSNDPTWRKEAKISVTKELVISTVSKTSKKCEKTKSLASNNTKDLEPCEEKAISQGCKSKAIPNKTKAPSEEKSISIVKANSNSSSPQQSKGQAQQVKSPQDQAVNLKNSKIKVINCDPNTEVKSCYLKKEVPVSSKLRLNYYQQHSSAIKNKDFRYQSAVDLSFRTCSKKETLISDNVYGSENSAQNKLTLSIDQHQTESGSGVNINHCERRVNPEKKRLCKSLSNLTAEDVLSVPCSSIFSGKADSFIRLTPKTIRANTNTISNQKFLEAQLPVEPNNEMSRHIKFSRSNGKLHISTSDQTKRNDARKETGEHRNGIKSSPCIIQEEKVSETKATKKTPKLPKGLFSAFMSKHRKRQSPPSADQGKPIKVQQNTDSSHSDRHGYNSKTTLQDVDQKVLEDEFINAAVSPYTDAADFKKLTVSPAQTQKNIHSAYASRVARVRNEGSKTSLANSANSSPKSLRSRDEPRDQTHFKNALSKDVKVVLRKKLNPRFLGQRFSADFSPSSDTAAKHFVQRRPSSLAVPGKDALKRFSDSTKSSFSLNCFSSSDNLNDDTEPFKIHERKVSGSVPGQSNTSQPKLLGFTKVRSSPKLNVAESSQDLLSKRCSLDLAAIGDESLPLSSTPDDPIKDSKSSNSFCGRTTPPSSRTASNSHLISARMSLASSLGSVFEDGDNPKKPNSEKQEDALENRGRVSTRSSNRRDKVRKVQRSKSLCRQMTATESLVVDSSHKRRSVSPLFSDLSFKTSASRSYNVNKKPSRASVSRHYSMKEIPSYLRPAKPTTPKPRKVSSAGSCSSLNKVNFQSITSLIDQSQQEQTDQSPAQSTKGVLLRNLDSRNRISAKNAQIRRRMSYQQSRFRNADPAENTRRVREYEDLKRNSMGAFDAEKLKRSMAKWSSASPSGNSNSSNRRSWRRARPLSEIQNVRWDVQVIPEHNELDNNHTHTDSLTNLPHQAAASFSVDNDVELLSLSDPIRDSISTFADDVTNVIEKPILGTCFSEEDIPSAYRDEEFGIEPILRRSFSLVADLHSIPYQTPSFNLKKFSWEDIQSSFSNYIAYPSFLLYGYSRQDKNKRKERIFSGIEGISNESGYGSMSRRGNHLHPKDLEDEEVFQNPSPRLSNCDFPTENGLYVEALWDHVTMDDEELGFKVGDVIRVIDMSNSDWWWGELDSKEGWFPATFVRILVNQHREYIESNDINDQQDDDCECSRITSFDEETPSCPCGKRKSTSSVHCSHCGRPWNGAPLHPRDSNHPKHPEIVISGPPPPPRKTSVTREHIRKNVINEIVNSEKVFVGHLRDVVEGYLARCRQRPDMFSNEQIAVIFSNIEEIYGFQRQFALELEEAVNRSAVHSTELGNVFLNNKSGFKVFSEYCNNHPQALSLLSQLFNVKKYMQFFEACRLLQRMIDISLDGFLLTPVQKICKYPLQLAELLKYTSPEHPDYEPVRSALVTMKNVAKMINERKRMLENIRKISLWQSSVMNWQGDDVLVKSKELVHSGEVYLSKQSKSKPKLRMAFLFDHQLIICKKDLLRKDLLYYKSRLDLDRYIMIPMDGCSPRSSANLSGDWSSTSSSVSGLFSWKLIEKSTRESITMQCKNEEDFDKWMKCFPQEREIALSKSEYDIDFRQELAKGLLKASLVVPRKPKDSTSTRAPSYRYRMKMAQESNFSKPKVINSAVEKGASGFLSNFAGKLTPFRRATTKEANPIY